ncbi:MAG: Spy/CpxP family protein refolding chaperone [Thermodesulfobacteriota bacterium]
MKHVKMMVPLATLMIVLFAVSAYAEPGWRCCGQGKGLWGSLNEDQVKKARDIQIEGLKKIEPLAADMSKKRLELMELASKDKYDDQAVQKKREELWALQDKIRAERRAIGTKIRGLLTDEQKKNICAFDSGAGCDLRGGGFGMGPGGCGKGGFGMRGGGCGMMGGLGGRPYGKGSGIN